MEKVQCAGGAALPPPPSGAHAPSQPLPDMLPAAQDSKDEIKKVSATSSTASEAPKDGKPRFRKGWDILKRRKQLEEQRNQEIQGLAKPVSATERSVQDAPASAPERSMSTSGAVAAAGYLSKRPVGLAPLALPNGDCPPVRQQASTAAQAQELTKQATRLKYIGDEEDKTGQPAARSYISSAVLFMRAAAMQEELVHDGVDMYHDTAKLLEHSVSVATAYTQKQSQRDMSPDKMKLLLGVGAAEKALALRCAAVARTRSLSTRKRAIRDLVNPPASPNACASGQDKGAVNSSLNSVLAMMEAWEKAAQAMSYAETMLCNESKTSPARQKLFHTIVAVGACAGLGPIHHSIATADEAIRLIRDLATNGG